MALDFPISLALPFGSSGNLAMLRLARMTRVRRSVSFSSSFWLSRCLEVFVAALAADTGTGTVMVVCCSTGYEVRAGPVRFQLFYVWAGLFDFFD
jgi:hypothetical protein